MNLIMIMMKIKGLSLRVIPIKNDFFGETITVSGLVTGRDLIKQLDKYEMGDGLILPSSMLKRDEKVFLDDTTVEDIEKSLNTKVIISDVDGTKLINILINEKR